MYDFEFAKPGTIAEAAAALADEGAQALGGGQTLLPTMKQRLAAPEVSGEPVGYRGDEGRVRVGCGRGLHRRAPRPMRRSRGRRRCITRRWRHLAGRIGDPAVRSRGTIGGSLANNDPSACYPAAVLGSGARVRTTRARDRGG
jgi:carbon-monoxide dehydrogenase medium subunit